MAIIKREDSSLDSFNSEINNGDLKALNEIVANWGFKDIESALRFGIAVLKVTKPGSLFQEKENGSKSILVPTDKLTGKEPKDGEESI
jgi:hypothetical protein